MAHRSDFLETMYCAGSWVVLFVQSTVVEASEAYADVENLTAETDLSIKVQKKQWFLEGGYLIGAKESDWTVILHRLGRWEQFDGSRLASRLSGQVVLFEGEDTSGSVQCTCYQADGREERFQDAHDAKAERELNEGFAEHVGEQPDSAQDSATEVESYDEYFAALGIIPLLVTENEAGDVLVTPDAEKQISGIWRVRKAATHDA